MICLYLKKLKFQLGYYFIHILTRFNKEMILETSVRSVEVIKRIQYLKAGVNYNIFLKNLNEDLISVGTLAKQQDICNFRRIRYCNIIIHDDSGNSMGIAKFKCIIFLCLSMYFLGLQNLLEKIQQDKNVYFFNRVDKGFCIFCILFRVPLGSFKRLKFDRQQLLIEIYFRKPEFIQALSLDFNLF